MKRLGQEFDFESFFRGKPELIAAYRESLKRDWTGMIQITKPSDLCRYGECDGSGLILYKNYDGQDVAVRCKCQIEEDGLQGLKSLVIPSAFKGMSFDDFKVDAYPDEISKRRAVVALEESRMFVDEYRRLNGMGLYYYSSQTGSGKTMLACVVLQEIIKKYGINNKVMYINLADWAGVIDKARNFRNEYSVSDVVDEVSDQELVLFDDIGCSDEVRGKVAEALYSVLNRRIGNKKVTIFTSNDEINQLGYDSRTISRINGMVKVINLPEYEVRGEVKESFVVQWMNRFKDRWVKKA